MAAIYLYIRLKYMGYLLRIFQEKPLFIVPRGEPPTDAEDVAVKTDDGLTLRGCYLKHTDPEGIGVFGISKGGGTGLLAAVGEKAIRCLVTDGAYGTHTTMVPYLKRWIQIYSDRKLLQRVLPTWFYGIVGMAGAKKVGRNRGVNYPSIEKAVARLNRPLLMIHGEADTYIKPEMARALYERARGPKELWVVPKAKHNQAITIAADDYHSRVVAFFDANLAAAGPPPSGTA